jgi:hypothetical protein
MRDKFVRNESDKKKQKHKCISDRVPMVKSLMAEGVVTERSI